MPLKIPYTDIERIKILDGLIDYIDYVELQEQKANSYKALKNSLKT